MTDQLKTERQPYPEDLRWQPASEVTNKELKTVMSSDPEVQDKNPPEPVTCSYCGTELYTEGFEIGTIVFWSPCGPERCSCPLAVEEYEKKEAERIAKKEAEEKEELNKIVQNIINHSGMGVRFLSRTFSNFEKTEYNSKALKVAKDYAMNFNSLLPTSDNLDPGRNGLFIAGSIGTGKTHLAAAIANHLMQGKTAVICMTMIDLLERIKKTYTDRGADESAVLNIYKTVPLLVIDDIGKEPATEWAISTIYNIINGRYEAYMPTIVTTNYSDKALVKRMTPRDTKDSLAAEAIIDRLMETCKGVVMNGPSWRQK